jgi:hypothetical protein
LEPSSAAMADTQRHPPALRALLAAGSPLQPHPHLIKLAVALRSLLWCSTAAPLLSRPSDIGDIAAVVAAGLHVPVPEGAAAMRHARSLLERGRAWRSSAESLLDLCGPVPLQPYYALLASSRRLPLELWVLEGRLDAVIVDGGRPYCVCRGLTGGLMVGCDFCDEWFHPRCVGLSDAEAAALLSPPDVTVQSAAEAQAEIEAAALAYVTRRGRSGRLKRGASAASLALEKAASAAAVAAAAVHESATEFRCPACCARAGLPYPHVGSMALNLQVSGFAR